MASVQHVTVTGPEAGQKLIQFLRRRLQGDVPQTALMRWIRTGQVRVDGGRAKPFQRVAENQSVRVPPFAPCTSAISSDPAAVPAPLPLTIVCETGDLLVIAKPAGLPVQPGSGHTDSVATRLAALYAGAPYIPAPAHRLDKQTTGLLLAGKTFATQARLHAAFRVRDAASGLDKRYLAWVAGRWPHTAPLLLEDHLAKEGEPGHAKVRVQYDSGTGRLARCEATCRIVLDAPTPGVAVASLLEIRLLTGRTHQLRVQLASRGFPLLGDRKYGGPTVEGARDTLFLHAWRITLEGGEMYEAAPGWKAPFDVDGE